ncbi:MAG TPA: LacI family DNA-binding transcriptional regulator [Streptosporangiaceae bacterium]|nr:LacI family DNA-binding transcriptional regulator [Streptosporangiaceae bacterium]
MSTSRSGQASPAAAGQVTIQDVARAAGVGRQTVSNVLNGSGRVGEATKIRVLEAMAALGYHPHHGARSLRSRRTRQLAYVMPHIQLLPGNYIMQQFLQALAAASARRSHSVVVVVPDGDPRDEIRRLVASRTVDAFLLSELQPDDPRVALLAEAGIPFACFGQVGPGLPQHWVDTDNHAAIIEAVEHVLARGFRRLVFVGYGSGNHWDHERVTGFRAGLARHGVPEDEAAVLLVDEASARRKIRSLLTGTHGRGTRPDAIVTGSDRLAAMVYGVAAELRLRIGRDLGVTGFDGSVAAGLLHPRLTSVTIPVEEIARRVIARALRQLDHGPDEAPGEVVPATLRLGESTSGGPGPVPGVDQGGSEAPWLPWKRFQGAELAGPGAGPDGRRVTIADVAADAGVGLGTVSRVLNGSDQVRAATLRAVQDSIVRLGYRPSHAAVALVRGTPRTVAVLVAHMTRPSTVVRLASALAVLAEEGYDTIVCNVETAAERDRHLETLLPTHRADGVLAISLPLSREQREQFGRGGVTLVSIDAAIPGIPQTIIDNVAGGRMAAGHLTGLGHRRIGFVGDMTFARPPAGLGFTSSADRLQGYRQALTEAGLAYEAGLVRRGPHDAATAAEHAAQLLKAHDPPTAIFAASDTQAIGVLAAADRLGVAVPGQLSVVGFDDIESAAFLGLSTVRQPLARSGTEGARRLCALLRGERLGVRRAELPLELVARASTARLG